MSYRIVSDASSNVLSIPGENYVTVPLHIFIGEQEWLDAPETDVAEFNRTLESFQGHTSTSCPSPQEWLTAFGDEEEIYCMTISTNLSGSYTSAMTAKGIYEEEHPERHVYVIDSMATGPRMEMMTDHLRKLLAEGITGEEAAEQTRQFKKKVGLLYTLQSIKRMADNGRVNPLLVKAVGILDLRIIGTDNPEGKVELCGKHRGAAKVLKGTYAQMLKMGYNGGRIIITHNQNEADSIALGEMARAQFGPQVQVEIHPTTVLCSFYAEKYGYIVGFEVEEAAKHHHLLEIAEKLAAGKK